MEGCEYKSSKDIGGKDFRLMLVDRAVNGWDEYRGTGTNAKERFATSSIQNLLNNPAALTHGKDRFEWIAVDAEHNIAEESTKSRVRLETTAFPDHSGVTARKSGTRCTALQPAGRSVGIRKLSG